MKLSALLAFALVCCARSLAAQESVGTPDSGVAVAFHQEDQTIKGTVTIPAGTCVFAAFRSSRMWEGYVRGAFEFAVDPDVPVGSVTFDLEAAVTPRAGNFVGLTSSWKLRKPERVPSDRYTLVGHLSSGAKNGGTAPAPARAVTLQGVTDARQADARATVVGTWTATYADGRPDDTVILDLWIGRDPVAILAQAPINESMMRETTFKRVRAHFYED